MHACIYSLLGLTILILMIALWHSRDQRNSLAILAYLDSLAPEKWEFGRDIVRTLARSGIKMSYGSFYTICRRLEKQRYIQGHLDYSNKEEGPRKKYSIIPGTVITKVFED